MKGKIKFREYKKDDCIYLENIIRKTWEYDLFCSEKVAKDMASLYLASCLASQTYTRVALIDNEPVGIIMARNIKKYRMSFRNGVNQIKKGLKLYLNKEGRNTLKFFSGINDLDKELLSKRNKSYDGEVAFFVVNEKCRGTGIGKALFNFVIEYFKKENIKEFYLYTDDTCNYGFYEHQGLLRCGEKIYEIPFKSKEKMKFYLYEGQI
ncbi:MAG: GNAT family N-acetyltransferase [Sarcina sp.]